MMEKEDFFFFLKKKEALKHFCSAFNLRRKIRKSNEEVFGVFTVTEHCLSYKQREKREEVQRDMEEWQVVCQSVCGFNRNKAAERRCGGERTTMLKSQQSGSSWCCTVCRLMAFRVKYTFTSSNLTHMEEEEKKRKKKKKEGGGGNKHGMKTT